MTSTARSPELRHALERLPADDPARPFVEILLAEEEPALWVAALRRLLTEIEREKGPTPAPTSAPQAIFGSPTVAVEEVGAP